MKEKLKAIWKLLTSEEYFLVVANQYNPYGEKELGPIKYEYMTNTDRELFYVFVKDHMKNYFKINDNKQDNDSR